MNVRKFIPFDAEVITSEFRMVESPSREKLMLAMERFQESFTDISPAIIKSGYDEGILEIRHENAHYKGRALFFPKSQTELLLLTVYRKESQKTVGRIIELAINRKRTFRKYP